MDMVWPSSCCLDHVICKGSTLSSFFSKLGVAMSHLPLPDWIPNTVPPVHLSSTWTPLLSEVPSQCTRTQMSIRITLHAGYRCSFLGATPSQNLWGWDPRTYIFNKPLRWSPCTLRCFVVFHYLYLTQCHRNVSDRSIECLKRLTSVK